MASETGSRRKATSRRIHNGKFKVFYDKREAEDAGPCTLKLAAFEVGVGYNPTRLMSLEAVQEARQKGLISPSSRGRLPDWATSDEARISPAEVKVEIVADFMAEFEIASFPDEERETLTAFIVGEVEIAYGSSAMKRLRQRVREQVATMQHTAGAVVEHREINLQLTAEMSQLRIDVKTMDKRWNERMDQMFRLLPAPSSPNAGGRGRRAGGGSVSPPPSPESGGDEGGEDDTPAEH